MYPRQRWNNQSRWRSMKAPKEADITIYSSRNVLRSAIVTNLKSSEDKGWIDVSDKAEKQALVAAIRNRQGITTFKPAQGRATIQGRKAAGKLAQEGISSQHLEISLAIPEEFRLRGAKLSTMTQAIAYAGIREQKERRSAKPSDTNRPTAAQIWKSIRHKGIARQIRNFLWKTMHGAYRLGRYWLHIPGFEDRATCRACGEIESMEHILLQCSRPGRAEIWKLAEDVWKKNYADWPSLSLGSILGSSLAVFKDNRGRALHGKTRLYRILVSESMYAIWKMRCDSVLSKAGELISVQETHNKWVGTINERILTDRVLATSSKYKKGASIPSALVLQTWSGTLKDEDQMPENWIWEPEVLNWVISARSPTLQLPAACICAFPWGWADTASLLLGGKISPVLYAGRRLTLKGCRAAARLRGHGFTAPRSVDHYIASPTARLQNGFEPDGPLNTAVTAVQWVDIFGDNEGYFCLKRSPNIHLIA
ncbi:hypothetical protein B0H19DRAFT_1067810 [Mycena capillaripes]|nr:hypothetical protein B0H19DRAFT_1067810 [Mycena capillaripes]